MSGWQVSRNAKPQRSVRALRRSNKPYTPPTLRETDNAIASLRDAGKWLARGATDIASLRDDHHMDNVPAANTHRVPTDDDSLAP